MMYFVVIVMAAAVMAEPPISKSYLPPSPNEAGYPKGPQGFQGSQGLQGTQGFQGSQGLQVTQGFQGPQGAGPFPGAPEVVAARSFGQGRDRTQLQHGNDLARNSLHATASHSEGYDSAFGRNGETAEPASYNFGYMVNDYEGTEFGHHEARQEERAQGEYHVVLPDGRKQTVSYEADERGFKPHISYQDSEDLARSGYDSNARNLQNGARGKHGNVGHDLHGNVGHDLHGNGDHALHSNGDHDLHGNGVHDNARSNGY